MVNKKILMCAVAACTLSANHIYADETHVSMRDLLCPQTYIASVTTLPPVKQYNVLEDTESGIIVHTETRMYTTTAVNLRTKNTTKSKSVKLLKAGKAITVLDKSHHKWQKIFYKGKIRYINSKYLSKKKPAYTNVSDTAVGEIIWNGEQTTGIIAKNLIGNMIIGKNLVISNQSGSYTIDDNGFKLAQGTKSIELNPTKPYMKLVNGDETLLDFNSDGQGNLTFGASVKLGWDSIKDAPTFIDENTVTEITRNTITTETLTANNLTAGSLVTKSNEYKTTIKSGITNIECLLPNYVPHSINNYDDIQEIVDDESFGLEIQAQKEHFVSDNTDIRYRSKFTPSTILLYKSTSYMTGRHWCGYETAYMNYDGLYIKSYIDDPNTSGSLPYIGDTNLLADGTYVKSDIVATKGRIIANGTIEGLSPSYSLVLASGLTFDNTYINRVKKVLDIVVISIKIDGIINTNTWVTVATLPSKCIPKLNTPLSSIITDAPASNRCDVRIIGQNVDDTGVESKEAGQLQVFQHGDTKPTKLHINLTYPIS